MIRPVIPLKSGQQSRQSNSNQPYSDSLMRLDSVNLSNRTLVGPKARNRVRPELISLWCPCDYSHFPYQREKLLTLTQTEWHVMEASGCSWSRGKEHR